MPAEGSGMAANPRMAADPRVAMITGGTSGIGLANSRRYSPSSSHRAVSASTSSVIVLVPAPPGCRTCCRQTLISSIQHQVQVWPGTFARMIA